MSNNTALGQPEQRKNVTPRYRVKSMATRLIGEDRILRAGLMRTFVRRRQKGRPLVLVHTMGKVGSTTIATALKAKHAGKKAVVFQPHFISPEGTAFAEALAIKAAGSWDQLPAKARRGFIRNRMLPGELARMRKDGERLTVVTVTRDPVATNLSGLFHNNKLWPAELQHASDLSAAEWNERMLQYFLANYPHDVPADWFVWEIEGVYGIDVFATPFDTAKGYQICRDDFTDLLVFKLESLNDRAPEAMAEFTGIPNFNMGRTNTASDKDYSERYGTFRNDLVLPESYLDRIYSSEMARHFYSPEEIEAFRRKWTKATQPA